MRAARQCAGPPGGRAGRWGLALVVRPGVEGDDGGASRALANVRDGDAVADVALVEVSDDVLNRFDVAGIERQNDVARGGVAAAAAAEAAAGGRAVGQDL